MTNKAREAWDTWIEKIHGELLTWKVLAILLSLGLIASMIFSGYHFTRPKFIPYVVFVKDNGDVNFKGRIDTNSVSLSSAMIRSYLIRFISDISKVSTDLATHKNNLRDAYYLVTQSGRQILTDYIGEAKSLEKAGEGDIYVDVRFLAFDQLGESTWSVDWREIERKTGVVIGTREMRGTFLYERGEAESIIEAENNPLGIYFSSFDIRERRRE